MPYFLTEEREVTLRYLEDLQRTSNTPLSQNYLNQARASMNYSPKLTIRELKSPKSLTILRKPSVNNPLPTLKEEIITEDSLLKIYAFGISKSTKITIKPLGVWDSMKKVFIKDLNLYEGLLQTRFEYHKDDFSKGSTIYYAYGGDYFPVAYIKVDLPAEPDPLVNELVLDSVSNQEYREELIKGNNFIIMGDPEAMYIPPWNLFKNYY